MVLIVSTGCYFVTGIIGYKVVAFLLLVTLSLLTLFFDILPIQDSELPSIERMIMKLHFWLKDASLSEEKGFGLDTNNVTIEKFPLIVGRVTAVNLKRIE